MLGVASAPMSETQKQSMQDLADQAQELKMGYESLNETDDCKSKPDESLTIASADEAEPKC
jgi:hypothetical protein